MMWASALISVGVLLAILGGFVVFAGYIRHRMKAGRFHGVQSAVGGTAYMGAPPGGTTEPHLPGTSIPIEKPPNA